MNVRSNPTLSLLSLLSLGGLTLALALLPVKPIYAQTAEPETETYDDYEEEDESLYNRRFWEISFGPSFPIGSSEQFFLPTNIIGVNPPEPYSEFFREGYTVNIATGVMTELGFEASLAFRITKINFSNRSTAQILTDLNEISSSRTYSSYLLGTQVYLGQRMKPISNGKESLYFGVGMELGALKHYSERFSAPDKATFGLSVIAGDEIPLQRNPENSSMIALRVQLEFVAMANRQRPRFVHLTFAIRGYSP